MRLWLLKMENHLPKSWITAELNQIADLIRGISYKKEEASNALKENYVGILRANNINEVLYFDDLVYVPEYNVSSEQYLRKGDIIIAMSSGSKHLVGKAAIALNDYSYSFGTFCGLIRGSQLLNKNYLGYFFQSREYRKYISEASSGTNINNLKREHLLELKISLPPLNEQNRIVDKLDELLSELEKGKEQLQTSLEQLKVYRQSILKHAFEGRLFNPDLNENELPEGWIRESFNDVSIKIGDIDHKMPKKVDNGIYPYISTGDITDENELDFTKAKRITKDDYTTLSRKIRPEKDDIIFPRYGTIGRNVLVKTDKEFLVSYSCAIIKPNKEKVFPKYIYYYSLSPQIKKEIEKHIVQTTQANVGISSIKSFEISYPILIDDQKLIVSKIEHIFSSAKKTEDEILTNLSKVDSLKQSLLQKAFEGKLVEQDPTDEAASALLERIKKEREEFLKAEKERKKTEKPLHIKSRKMAEELKRILEILKESKEPVSAKTLWQSSTHKDDIDDFYAALKKHIESGEIIEMPRKGKESFLKLADAK